MTSLLDRLRWALSQGCGASEKAVLFVLAYHADDAGVAWPSVPTLAAETSLSPRGVQSAIGRLAGAGLIEIERSSGRHANRYRLTMDSTNPAAGAGWSESEPRSGCRVEPRTTCRVEAANPAAGAGFEDDQPRTTCRVTPQLVQGNPANRVIPLRRNYHRTTKEQPSRAKRREYSDDFETIWSDYPTRAGGNQKAAAYRAYRARLKDGHAPETIHAGVKRYAAFVLSTGKTGTEYVKQAKTFLGPDEDFLEPWLVPAPAKPPAGGTDPRPSHQVQSRDW